MIRRIAVLLGLAFLVVAASPASAVVWTTGGSSTTWSWGDIANWASGAGPVPNAVDATADFTQADLTGNSTVNLDGSFTVGTLKFADTAPLFNWTIANGAGTNTLTLDVSTGAPEIKVDDATRTATISATLAGTEGFSKTGAGTLSLTAANLNLQGTISVQEGRLTLGHGNAAKSADISLASGTTLAFIKSGSANAHYYTGTITATGVLTLAAAVNNITHTLHSDITLAGIGGASTLYAGKTGSGGSLIMGKLYIDSNLTIGHSTLHSIDAQVFEVAGIKKATGVAGLLDVTKTSTQNGTIVISGESDYGGTTNAYAGTLLAAHNDAFGAGAVSLGTGSTAVTLGLGTRSGGGETSAPVYANGGVTVANNIVVNAGSGPNEIRTIKGFNKNGTVEYSGDVTLNWATTLAAAAGGTTVFSGLISSGGSSYNVSINSTTDTGILKLAPAAPDLADNTFIGAITVSGGTLQATTDRALGDLANTVTLNDGTKFSADGTFDTARTFTFGGAATIEATAGNTLGLNTVLSGILTKTGTGTVSLKGENPNTASATWVVNAGTLLLDKTADMAGTNHGGAILSPVTVNNGGTLKNAANEQIDDDVSVTLQDGSVWDLGGMNEKINFMVYNGGALVNATGLTMASPLLGTFVYDGVTLSDPVAVSDSARLVFATHENKGTVSNTVTLSTTGAAPEIYVNNGPAAVDGEISGKISGATSILKTGLGTLLLSNLNNDFGGAGQTVTVQAGTLQITGDGALGNAANQLVLAGGAIGLTNTTTYAHPLNMTSGGGFDVAAGATVTVASTGIPTGSGELYKSGAGKLVVTSDFVHTGSLDVRAGILEFDNADHLNVASLSGLTLSGGQLAFAGAAGTITKDINIAAPGSVVSAAAGSVLTLHGTINGGTAATTALTVAGGGKVVIDAGTFNTTGGSTFAGNILITNGSTLELKVPKNPNETNPNVDEASDSNARQSGLGANNKQIALDNGTFRIGGTPAENWSYRPGNVGDVLNKQFRIDAGGGTFDVAEGLRFDLGVGTGPADTFTNHNLFGSGDLTKTGLGTLVLGGYHQPVGYGMKDFTGAIDVTAGTLRVGHALGLGSTDKGTTIRSGAVLSFNIDREGWTRDETYAEPVTLEGGATLQAASTHVSTLTGLITLAGNATIDVIDATAQGRLDIAGKVTGAGGFTKTGNRPLVLSSAENDFTGPVAVEVGTLRLAPGAKLLGTPMVAVATGAALEVQGGAVTVAEINGAGHMSVGIDATTTAELITAHVRQDTLTINAGSKVKIIAAGTSVVNSLQISDAADFDWGAGGSGFVPAGATGGNANHAAPVPEPAAWLMVVVAALAGFVAWRRRG